MEGENASGDNAGAGQENINLEKFFCGKFHF